MSRLTALWDWMPGWILTALNFGMKYPDGDEDDLFALGDDWKTAAAALRALEPELRAVTDAAQKFYTGDGATQAAREFGTLFSGPYSIEETAKALEDLGRYTRQGGTDIEHTKIMEAVFAGITVYSIFQLLSTLWGSFGVPLVLATGRTSLTIVARQGANRLAMEAGAVGLRTLLKPYLRQIVIAGLKMGVAGAGLDFGVQGAQVLAGHRDDGIDLAQTLQTGVLWTAGGLVGAPVGMGVNRLLGNALTPTMRGVVSGVLGGAAGGVGMYGAGIGYQAADQWARNGHVDWSRVDTTFHWQMVAGGAALGGMHGARAPLGEGPAARLLGGDAAQTRPASVRDASAPEVNTAGTRAPHSAPSEATPGAPAAGERPGAGTNGREPTSGRVDAASHQEGTTGSRESSGPGARPSTDGSAPHPESMARPEGGPVRPESMAGSADGAAAPEHAAARPDSGPVSTESAARPESGTHTDGAARTDSGAAHTGGNPVRPEHSAHPTDNAARPTDSGPRSGTVDRAATEGSTKPATQADRGGVRTPGPERAATPERAGALPRDATSDNGRTGAGRSGRDPGPIAAQRDGPAPASRAEPTTSSPESTRAESNPNVDQHGRATDPPSEQRGRTADPAAEQGGRAADAIIEQRGRAKDPAVEQGGRATDPAAEQRATEPARGLEDSRPPERGGEPGARPAGESNSRPGESGERGGRPNEHGTGARDGEHPTGRAPEERAGPRRDAPVEVVASRGDLMEGRAESRAESPTGPEGVRYDSALPNGEGVVYRPESTSIGEDPATHHVRENVRNEGEHDVIVHGTPDGAPVPSNRFQTHPEQIVEAIRNNPHYRPGTPIRLLACHSGNRVGWAQYVADSLGVTVRAPTDAVGTPRRADSPAIIRGDGEWVTFRPRGAEAAPRVARPGELGAENPANQRRSAFDDPPGWDYMGKDPPPEHPPAGDPIAEVIESEHGIPVRNQRRFQDFVDGSGEYIVEVRPSNPESVKWIEDGHPQKPVDIKAKTIGPLDTYIGARPQDRGLVGFFEPKPPKFEEIPAELHEGVQRRYDQRLEEYQQLREKMERYTAQYAEQPNQAKYTVENGVVYGRDAEHVMRPMTGDHDLFDVRHLDGRRLTEREYEDLITTMSQLGLVQHGAHKYWVPLNEFEQIIFDTIDASHRPGGEQLVRFAPGEEPTIIDGPEPSGDQ